MPVPVPAVYGAVVATVKQVQATSNINSGKKAMAHIENLPLLVAQDSCRSFTQQHAKLPQFAHRIIARAFAKRIRGIILVAASAFALSWSVALAKDGAVTLPTAESLFWRFAVAYALTNVAIGVRHTKLRVKRKVRRPLAGFCFAACGATALSLVASLRLDEADMVALTAVSPVLTFLLARHMLKEKISRLNFCLALLAVAGVVMTVRPEGVFGAEPKPLLERIPRSRAALKGAVTRVVASAFLSKTNATVLALLGAALQAVAFVQLRSLRKVHHLVVMHYFLLLATALSLALLLLVDRKFSIEMTVAACTPVAGVGALFFLAQLFLTRGFQFETAGTAALVTLLSVAFVFLWDLALLGGTADPVRIAGAALVGVSSAAIAFRKVRSHWAARHIRL